MNKDFLKALYFELFKLEEDLSNLIQAKVNDNPIDVTTNEVLKETNRTEIKRIERLIDLYTKTHITWPH